MATADLAVELVGPAAGPWVEARGSVLRRGRTTLVVEALVVSVDEDGTDVEVDGGRPGPVAWASMTFAVLPAEEPRLAGRSWPPSSPCGGGSAAVRSPGRSWRRSPVTVLDAAAGRVSVPVRPYLHNSFGAIQGGVIALIAEAAGAEALGRPRASPARTWW